MGMPVKWWDEEENEEPCETKQAFRQLLESLRTDTPQIIVNLIKQCVSNPWTRRPRFKEVKVILIKKLCKDLYEI